MRRTKAFSYDSRDEHVFKRLAREAKSQKPPASESAMLMHVLEDYFYRIDEIRKINTAAFDAIRPKQFNVQRGKAVLEKESGRGKRRGPAKKKR